MNSVNVTEIPNLPRTGRGRYAPSGYSFRCGARRKSRVGRILKQGLTLTVCGIIIGVIGALAVNRLIASLLFGVLPTDPTILVTAIATIMFAGTAACWIPAWRASRLDPNVTLRDA